MTTIAPPMPRAGPAEWLLATDHKRTAARMAVAAFVFFIASGVLALLMRSELADPGLQLVSRDTYNQLFTMHGSTMIFLVLFPAALALGVYMVPLQVGAAEIAGPRLTLLGHWLIVAGGLTMYSGFLTDHGAGKAGWTAYYPLSGDSATPGPGMDLWLIGVIIVGVGCTIVGATILATI